MQLADEAVDCSRLDRYQEVGELRSPRAIDAIGSKVDVYGDMTSGVAAAKSETRAARPALRIQVPEDHLSAIIKSAWKPDEEGRLLAKVLVTRIEEHATREAPIVGPDLHLDGVLIQPDDLDFDPRVQACSSPPILAAAVHL